MPDQAAYAPKERFSDPDQLGSVFIGGADFSLNVREAVHGEESEYGPQGFLLTDDPFVIRALDAYEPLKRVSVSEVEDAKPKRSAAKSKGDDS